MNAVELSYVCICIISFELQIIHAERMNIFIVVQNSSVSADSSPTPPGESSSLIRADTEWIGISSRMSHIKLDHLKIGQSKN